jgi:hypothetical protein
LNRDVGSFTSASDAASAILPSIARAFGARDEGTLRLAHVHERGGGPAVARYEQRVGDLEVFRGGVSLVMDLAHRPIAASGLLASSTRGSERPFRLSSTDALALGARLLGAALTFSPAASKDGYERFSAPGLVAPARVKRVLYPVAGADGVELEPAYYVELMTARGPSRAWIVAAEDGRVLLANELTRGDAAFTYRVYADPTTKLPDDGPQGNGYAPHPTGVPDHQKLAYEPSQMVSLQNFPFSKNDPWLPADATTTKGNNVWAYADVGGTDGYDEGTDVAAKTTAAATFDFAYDTATAPNASTTQLQASITQLFYVTNFLHDWYYDAGFDEASHNHQADNLGRGGKEGDPLRAEAQDFSGTNNANAQVPPDGQSPIIQMFVFSGSTNASLEVTAPSSIAGTKNVGIASGFGEDVFDVTGAVVLASDGATPDVADACEALDADVSGKIVLAHRGTCSFAQKAANAEAAGAIGAIIVNVDGSANPSIAPFMGGQQSGITIPVLSLNVADGKALEAASAAGATARMKRAVGSNLDGALDTAIVAHEWGHVLSGRLVGDGMGLTTNQSGGLGEGWGDFSALLLTVRADDPGQFSATYANGAYATSGSGPDIYFGTRRLPYSIDFKKNALTLKHIANGNPLPVDVPTSFGEDGSFNAEAHNTGEVWASMLWECYAALLRDGRLSFAEAQERMKRYLVASLKLTPVDPTIIEARDALLAAALATDEGDFQLFWQAFARRGAGAGAVAPPKDSSTNQGVRESFLADNDLEVVDWRLSDDVISCDHDGLLDEDEVGTIELTVRNSGSGTLAGPRAELRAKTAGLVIVDPAPATLPPLKPFESAKIAVRASLAGAKPADPVELEVSLTDAALPESTIVSVPIQTRFDADQAAQSSAVDRVDTAKTAWRVTGDSRGTKWSRSTTTGDGYWAIPDASQTTDQKLTSPAFTIEDRTFSLAFKHKWALFFSTRRNAAMNGGVVELSVDAGKTWKDLSTYGAVDYNVTLDDSGRTDNPLKGRKAYGSTSKNYPDEWVDSRVDVTLPQHPESVMIRFRYGATFARPGDGWLVDDVQLDGISSTPFWSYVPQADACDPNGPSTNAGPPQVVPARATVKLAGSATHPEDKPLTYLWSQVAGPAVTLSDAATLTPSFVAPDVTDPLTISFVLRAHDGALLSAPSQVDVVVQPPSAASEGSGCTCRSTPGGSRGGARGLALVGLVMLAVRRIGRRGRRDRAGSVASG